MRHKSGVHLTRSSLTIPIGVTIEGVAGNATLSAKKRASAADTSQLMLPFQPTLPAKATEIGSAAPTLPTSRQSEAEPVGRLRSSVLPASGRSETPHSRRSGRLSIASPAEEASLRAANGPLSNTPLDPSRRGGGKVKLTMPGWRAYRERFEDCWAWSAFTGLLRYCQARQIDVAAVDEAVVEAFAEDFARQGKTYGPVVIARMRLAVHQQRLADLTGIAPRLAPPSKRRHARQDQWASLSAVMRADMEALAARRGHPADSALTTERNLILRALAVATRGGAVPQRLADLWRDKPLILVIKDPAFGKFNEPSTTRSKFIELGRVYAKLINDQPLVQRLSTILKNLPQRTNVLPKAALRALWQFDNPRALHRLVQATEETIVAYANGERARGVLIRTQTALGVRMMLAESFPRERIMQVRFDGPARCVGPGTRPTLQVGDEDQREPVEPQLSDRTVTLIDAYWLACLARGFEPNALFADRHGAVKHETTVSEAVRRFGASVDLTLSLTILRNLTVQLLITRMRDQPDAVSERDIKDHLRVEQLGNFLTRYRPLLDEDAFGGLARATGLDSEGRAP